MGASERSVRHLRIRAASEAQVRSTVIRLEDALRCASLPDAATRVLLVRRLNLGVMAPDASPQSLSRLLEQRVAAAGGTWQHGGSVNAAAADFVFFHDALDARIELALRLAHHAPCTAWYWPLAVPEFEPVRDVPSNLCRMAQAIAALPEAAAALPAWIARLAASGAVPLLARAITPLQGAALLRAAHVPAAPRGPYPSQRAAAQPWTTDNTHATAPAWLSSLALAGGYKLQDTAIVPPASSGARATPVAAPDAPLMRSGPQTRTHTGTAPLTHAPRQISTPVTPACGGGPDLPDSLPAAPSVGAHHAQAAATAFGGLLFMLPLLQRLGYAAWAANLGNPTSAAVIYHLFRLILQRLRAPPDDPAWQLAYPACADDFDCAPARVADAQRWLLTCRRWLRRQARIGVASLVRRPAALSITVTHADVYFRLSATDIRVRRAGLDIDPGWIPWYGKVVTFHYTESHPGGIIHGG